MEAAQIEQLVAEAKSRWAIIREDFQGYKEFLKAAYLVISHSRGQIELDEKIDGASLEDVCIEVRFKTLDEAIQAIKGHPLVNREKTPQSQASIRVALV